MTDCRHCGRLPKRLYRHPYCDRCWKKHKHLRSSWEAEVRQQKQERKNARALAAAAGENTTRWTPDDVFAMTPGPAKLAALLESWST